MKNKNKSVHRFKKHLALITLILIAAGAVIGLTIRQNNLNSVASSLDESAQPLYKLEGYLREKYASSISDTTPVHKTCYKVFRLKYDKGEKWCGHDGMMHIRGLNARDLLTEVTNWTTASGYSLLEPIDTNITGKAEKNVYRTGFAKSRNDLNRSDIVVSSSEEGVELTMDVSREVLDFLPGYSIEDR